MVKKGIQAAILVISALAIFWAYQWLFPGDLVRIQKIFKNLETQAAISPSDSQLAMVGKANQIANAFAEDGSIEIPFPLAGNLSVSGRGDIRSNALAGISSLKGRGSHVTVQFLNPGIRINPEKTEATVEVSAVVQAQPENQNTVQDLQFVLKKIEGDWKIFRVAPLETIQRVNAY